MRVLLIQPPMILHKTDIPQFGHPLGLAYIAAFLREHGCEVSILDSIISNPVGQKNGEWIHIGLDWDSIMKKVSEYKPRVVGISCMFTSQVEYLHRLTKLVKDINRNIVTVVGGAHVTASPQEVLSDKNVDYVVLGEGELTMLKIIQYLANRFRLEEIDGIGSRENGHIILKPRTNFISDLDSLPFPAWDLLEMNKYAKQTSGCGPIIRDTPFFSISSSRGCPMNCIFCSVRNIWGHRWRARSAKNVVDEIEALVRNYNIKEIDFIDDSFLADRKRIEEICDEIVKRKFNISWAAANGANINSVQYDLLRKMKESGLFYLSFGIESGNEYIRDKVVRKHILVQHAKEVIRQCRDLNIWTHTNFILGLPEENVETFLETINFSQELNADSASFFAARVLPGTDLGRLCQEKGYVAKNNVDNKSRATLHLIQTEAFTPQDLEKWRKRAYRRYIWHAFRREVLCLNLIRRLSRMRSISDVGLLLRIGFAAYKRFIGLG